MLQPKRSKHLKQQKRYKDRLTSNLGFFHVGRQGLKTLDSAYLPAKTLETFRRLLMRRLKRSGKIWVKTFPQQAVSQKPAAVRMGKGKGSHKAWVCKIPAGGFLFEVCTNSEHFLRQARYLIAKKAYFTTKCFKRIYAQN
jgi:large subunit ribosomal protein L16